MNRLLLAGLLLTLSVTSAMAVSPLEYTGAPTASGSRAFVPASEMSGAAELSEPASTPVSATELAALWPSGGKGGKESAAALTPKSPRKAFFLSLLLPGLGEYYAGSNRGAIFLAVEAAGWWTYAHYTGKGNDLEDEYEAYADAHWHYSSDTGYSYVGWFQQQLDDNDIDYTLSEIDSYDDLAGSDVMETLTTALTEAGETNVSHALPSTKTQQYYEMIGKYPQFVFGWEDVAALNTSLADSGYTAGIRGIQSAMRDHYEDLRHDSNTNLKIGMDGVKILILNRIVSAVDAARVAYHRNQGLNSELSMIRVNFIQKQILDNRVPMLVVWKQF